MVLQAEEDHRFDTTDRDTMGRVNNIFAMPMASPAPTAPVAWGITNRSSLPKMDGGTIPIEYIESSFKDRYLEVHRGGVADTSNQGRSRGQALLLQWQSLQAQYRGRNGENHRLHVGSISLGHVL